MNTNSTANKRFLLHNSSKLALLYFLAFVTSMIMGLRYQIGADWYNYTENYDTVQLLDFFDALKTFDVGYALIVYISTRIDGGMIFVNMVCALIMNWGMLRFCRKQQNPALSFVVAIPYLMIVVGMGYTRQGVAIGILLAGLSDASDRSLLKLIGYILLAALFHRTALLVMPMVMAPVVRRNLLYAIAAGIGFLTLCVLLLRDSSDQLITTYITQDYESSGAAIRVAMNIVPAILAIIYRKQFKMTIYQRDMWVVFAVASIALLPLTLTASFTTAIDRFALFMIPLQLAILPQIPYVFSSRKSVNAQLLIAVCSYCFAVQLVWLVFATHSAYWLPYKAYIFNV